MTFLSAILWISVVLFLLVIVLEIAMRFAPNYKLATLMPGIPPHSFFRTLSFLSSMTPENTFTLVREWATMFKQSYGTWSLVAFNLEVIRAAEMEMVLSSSKHTQKGMVYELLRPFMGDGLLNANGKKWQQRRRILTPTFHFTILQQFLAVFK